jgi:hypothetical protein
LIDLLETLGEKEKTSAPTIKVMPKMSNDEYSFKERNLMTMMT